MSYKSPKKLNNKISRRKEKSNKKLFKHYMKYVSAEMNKTQEIKSQTSEHNLKTDQIKEADQIKEV